MKIAIVDDEKIWRTKIEAMLNEYEWKEQIQINLFSSGEAFLKKGQYDIVFLDIEMDGIDGFETAQRYKEYYEDSIIIFLTTHTELSSRGYMVNAFRYIDKAFVEDELQEAVNAIKVRQIRNYHVIFHELRMGERSIPLKDIYYIETEKRNVIIHAKEKDYVSNRTMDEWEEELKEKGFFRSHRSFLVNLEQIRDFDKSNVHLKNHGKALVSMRKYWELKQRYLEQNFKIANS